MRYYLLFLGVIMLMCSTAIAQQDTSAITVKDDSVWVMQCFEEPLKMGPEYRPDLVKAEPVILLESGQIIVRSHNRHGFWLFVIFMVQIMLLVSVRLVFEKNFLEQIRAFTNLNIAQQLQRDQETSLPFSDVVLNLSGFMSVALLTYLTLLHYTGWDDLQRGSSFAYLLLLCSSLFVAKYLIMKATSVIFPFKDVMNLYNFSFFLNHQLIGVVLIPLNMIIAYADSSIAYYVMIATWVLLGLSFILLAIKGLTMSRSYWLRYNFHFIMYICSLEIAPLLILYKVFEGMARG